MLLDQKIIFNHNYLLKHDLKRTYIYTREDVIVDDSKANKKWSSKIHPIYAMMFSFAVKPIRIKELIYRVKYFFDMDYIQAKDMIYSFYKCETPFHSKFEGVISVFPKKIFINTEELTVPIQNYNPKDFIFSDINFKRERMFLSPMTVVLMPNNDCSTDCIYCYADKQKKNQLDYKLMTSIIEQCKAIQISKVFLTGGDIFRYQWWKELLFHMEKNGFRIGLLSTKTPISKEDVLLIKKYNAQLQFSLDSINPVIIKQLWGVNESYLEKIKTCFHTIDSVGFQFRIATVLTDLNGTPEIIDELYQFIKQFKSVVSWTIRLAMKSLYSKSNFEDLKLSASKYEIINRKIKDIQKQAKFEIEWNELERKYFYKEKEGSRHFLGARCSANYSNIMILPDGKVTICEQLYWNPNYIIGDVNIQTIKEIWTSKKALELAFPKQETFRDESPCSKCKIYEECYTFSNRCIVDVLKGYGEENNDYPDPRCGKAPQFINNLDPIKNE